MPRILATSLLIALGASALTAAPVSFSKDKTISFFREVSSRDLSGLAVRSDGRIIHGPTFETLPGNSVEDLWWDIEPWQDFTWLVGSGPNGKVLKVEIDESQDSYSAEVWAETKSSQIFTVKSVSGDRVIGGGAPKAAVYLWAENGELLQSINLPGDSVLDILPNETGDTVWVATGNPGEVYQIDLESFAASSIGESLEERGIQLKGSIRDRNVRRLAWGENGVLLAGSSPSGNIYEFPLSGGTPTILVDQESGEVTDIHVSNTGDVYATVVVSGGTTTRRVTRATNLGAEDPTAEKTDNKPETVPAPSIMEAPPPVEKFDGRSSLYRIPGGIGLPEAVSSRNNLAMYQIASYQDQLLLAGGDDGELVGYDPAERRAISYPGSNSAQLTELVQIPTSNQFLVMTNNPAGLSRLDFSNQGKRLVKTQRINLQTPSEIGLLRFNRLRDVNAAEITIRMRANRGRDAREGWTPWVEASHENGGWRAPGILLGQYVELEIELPASLSEKAQLDQAKLYYLPQNRRPVLQSFRLISPNFGLDVRGPASPATTNLNLGQVIGSSPSPNKPEGERRRQVLLSSPVVPQPGSQVAMWTVTDPDSDNLVATFSIRAESDVTWTDLAVQSDADWVQFDRRTFPEGTYFTRLLVEESAPRRSEDRRQVAFQTDDLVIDHSPPVVSAVQAQGRSGMIEISFEGVDKLSLISSAALVFNNGYELELGMPVDGILDSPSERFVVEIEKDRLLNATSVEIYVGDKGGNFGSRRYPLN